MAVSAVLVVVAGCAGDGSEEGADVTMDSALSEAIDVASLEENRTPYLGDNSRVVALVGATGPRAVGESTLELRTGQRPYGLVLNFSAVADGVTPDVADDLMMDRATLLLATIDNVDEVRWTLPEDVDQGEGGVFTRGEADALVGSSVAEIGATAEGLEELVSRLEED